ncbi:MAG TPA: hypothetical protein PK156_35390 [Polyangium sp.]|nr:hypothetical protein [Polyangium sp.]
MATCSGMQEVVEQEVAFGAHRLRIKGDCAFVTVHGTLAVDDMQTILDCAARIKEKHKVAFFCYDGRKATGINADARKVAAKGDPEKSKADLRVIYGISFPLRVVVNMLVRTQKALFNREVHVHIFDEEKEALEFFEVESARLRKLLV